MYILYKSIYNIYVYIIYVSKDNCSLLILENKQDEIFFYLGSQIYVFLFFLKN